MSECTICKRPTEGSLECRLCAPHRCDGCVVTEWMTHPMTKCAGCKEPLCLPHAKKLHHFPSVWFCMGPKDGQWPCLVAFLTQWKENILKGYIHGF